MRILNEILKNLKIILRSWTSMFLLVFGPLLLIIIIGITFSGETVNGIKIGIHTESRDAIQPLIQNISAVGEVYEYDNITSCLSDLQLSLVHLCMDIAEDGGEVPGGTFTFYYDASRKKLSTMIISELNLFVGQTAEEITLESTKGILNNIQQMVVFLVDRRDELSELSNQSVDVLSKLEKRKEKLEELNDEFKPRYRELKKVQAEVNASFSVLDASKSRFDSSVEAMRSSLQSFLGISHALSYLNLSFNTTSIDSSSAALLSSVDSLTNETDSYYALLMDAHDQFNSAVDQIDQLNAFLDEEIRFNDQAITEISSAVKRVEEISAEMDKSIESLSVLDPSLAERITKPIIQEYSPLKSFRNIELVFPGLLVMVIVFITILFSNILMLEELHSEAHFRSLIAPVSKLLVPAGILLTNIILVFFQMAILLVIGQYKFGIPLTGHLPSIIAVSLLMIVLFTLLGMSFAYMFPSVQTSILITTFTGLAFYLFSSIVTPLELMPVMAAKFAMFNPVVIAEGLLRVLISYGIGLSVKAVILLVFYIAVMAFVLVSLVRKS